MRLMEEEEEDIVSHVRLLDEMLRLERRLLFDVRLTDDWS
jgi:hypothetical protein